jgi:ribosomal protein L3 glutamine methyltransferase
MRALPSDYRHEPAPALTGGRDGLDLVRRMLAEAAEHLAPRGILVVAIGHNRAAFERADPRLAFTWLSTSAGREHVFLLRRRT